MALQSICPKCSNSSFELVDEKPIGSKFVLSFIRCSSCGCVVGTADYYNIGNLLNTLAKKLNINLQD